VGQGLFIVDDYAHIDIITFIVIIIIIIIIIT